MDGWLTQFLSENGLTILYAGTLAILLLCGMGVPIPEEATFLAAGYAASMIPHAHLGILCVIGVVGILAGDTMPFLLGRHYGTDLMGHRFLARLLTPARLATTREFFHKHGSKTVFCARFVAGLRMPTFFVAGSMHVRYRTFLFWDLMGALISCPTSIVLAYLFGWKAEEILKESKVYVLAFAAGLALWFLLTHCCGRRDTAVPPAVAPTTPPQAAGPQKEPGAIRR